MAAAAIVVMAFVAIGLLLGTTTTTAQVLWNPPCSTIMIRNTTPCTADVQLVTTPPGVLPPSIILAGGGVFGPVGVPSPFVINGINSGGANFYPAVAPPAGLLMPPPAPPIPPCAWIPNVTLGPLPGCCFDVYFDCKSCVVWLMPSSGPPPCRP
jgi:hypothetical protein